jgi:hypothetical protein
MKQIILIKLTFSVTSAKLYFCNSLAAEVSDAFGQNRWCSDNLQSSVKGVRRFFIKPSGKFYDE